jgi:predicted nucleic acid-binding protein
MAFVLDASVSAVWALADEVSSIADRAAERLKSESAFVPSLWQYEVRNLLIVNERRLRMTVEDTRVFLELLSSYPIQTDGVEDGELTLKLARSRKLSFYDAAYLAVAKRREIPIATLDKALQTAAAAEGIPLLA